MPRSFQTSDGVRIAYRGDDFTDPWKTPATLLLLHAAMGIPGAGMLLCRRSVGTIVSCGWICAVTVTRRFRQQICR